jgi:hypothetical protein
MSSAGQWYGIFLGNSADALTPRIKIRTRFMVDFAAEGRPVERRFSLSTANPATGGKVALYFSPRAERFAKTMLGAAPTVRPPPDRLTLAAGDQRCWSVLFPNEAPPRTSS